MIASAAIWAAVLLLWAAGTAQAADTSDWVLLRVTGTIDEVRQPERLPFAAKAGDPVTFTYQIRAAAPATGAVEPLRARYPDSVMWLKVAVSGSEAELAISADQQRRAANYVTLMNDYRVRAEPAADVYSVTVAEAENESGIRLTASFHLTQMGHSPKALDSIAYAALPPDADRFAVRSMHVTAVHGESSIGFFRARIDRIDVLPATGIESTRAAN